MNLVFGRGIALAERMKAEFGVLKYAVSGSVRLYNERIGIQQRERVERFAERIRTQIVGCIPQPLCEEELEELCMQTTGGIE